jgi:hypothetical protein
VRRQLPASGRRRTQRDLLGSRMDLVQRNLRYGFSCRPIYVGNFEYDATSREIEKLCERYGDLERVDMKTG